MRAFSKFEDRYNKSKDYKPSSQSDIDKLEKDFGLYLPHDYKMFLLNIGNIWTPDILDIIVDKEIELNDVQQFWSIDEIINDKLNGWTKNVSTDILPFATDCMGNIFSFLTNDLKNKTETSDIYFYDHVFNTVEKISNSFTAWLDAFNKL